MKENSIVVKLSLLAFNIKKYVYVILDFFFHYLGNIKSIKYITWFS